MWSVSGPGTRRTSSGVLRSSGARRSYRLSLRVVRETDSLSIRVRRIRREHEAGRSAVARGCDSVLLMCLGRFSGAKIAGHPAEKAARRWAGCSGDSGSYARTPSARGPIDRKKRTGATLMPWVSTGVRLFVPLLHALRVPPENRWSTTRRSSFSTTRLHGLVDSPLAVRTIRPHEASVYGKRWSCREGNFCRIPPRQRKDLLVSHCPVAGTSRVRLLESSAAVRGFRRVFVKGRLFVRKDNAVANTLHVRRQAVAVAMAQ